MLVNFQFCFCLKFGPDSQHDVWTLTGRLKMQEWKMRKQIVEVEMQE